ncbi:hypothetical protein ABIA23_003415 [Sinorhizobium fredii]
MATHDCKQSLRLRLIVVTLGCNPVLANDGLPMVQEIETGFERVRRLAEAAGLPETTVGTSYGTPALLVKGKSFVRTKDAETLVVMCALEEKEMLMELDPSLFFRDRPLQGLAGDARATRHHRRCGADAETDCRLAGKGAEAAGGAVRRRQFALIQPRARTTSSTLATAGRSAMRLRWSRTFGNCPGSTPSPSSQIAMVKR